MPLEIIFPKENQILEKEETVGYKCNHFNFAARGLEEGGKVVITADKGQTSEKRIDIELITGKMSIKSLGIQIIAK